MQFTFEFTIHKESTFGHITIAFRHFYPHWSGASIKWDRSRQFVSVRWTRKHFLHLRSIGLNSLWIVAMSHVLFNNDVNCRMSGRLIKKWTVHRTTNTLHFKCIVIFKSLWHAAYTIDFVQDIKPIEFFQTCIWHGLAIAESSKLTRTLLDVRHSFQFTFFSYKGNQRH